MIESLITLLQSFPTWALVVTAFGVAYVENLFPPSPSDVLMVFIGSLVGMGLGDFSTFLISSTLGSIGGFCTAYLLGRRYGEAIADSPLVPFITREMLVRVEKLFDRYHGLIIIANRFLAGTRAVVAFAAGVVRLPLPRTLAYSAVSALAWNAVLLWIGTTVGQRWRDVEGYLTAYGWVITGAIAVAALIWFLRRRRKG
ncbi:MAG: DedA family protein [Candidatus Kapabacteria bacterium]|nr:DedA family protein [Candidatus Kapabacteria bacterium]